MLEDAVRAQVDGSHTMNTRERRHAMVAACIGNSLENYDWLIYAAFTSILATHFFPTSNPTAALLGTLAIFAVGFFFRPLGGIILTALADRGGRKFALIVSIGMMAAGTMLIGISPTYEHVGLFAPLLLFLARALQGLSLGGEQAAVASYLNEEAPVGRRGLVGSAQYATLLVGSLVATGLSALLTAVLSKEELAGWGWRIPFIFGGLIGLATLYMRRRMHETEAFAEVASSDRRAQRPMATLLRNHKLDVLRLFLLTGLAGVWFYTFASYLPAYVSGQGMDGTQALVVGAIALTAALISAPLIGHLSDRFGRPRFVLAFTAFSAVSVVPLLAILKPTFGSLMLVQIVALLGYSLFGAAGLTAMTEQFPTEVRAVGTGLPYAFGFAIFGGTAPLLLEWLSSNGLAGVFPWYVACLAILAFIATLSLRDRRDVAMRDI